jgi:hypothetical protein
MIRLTVNPGTWPRNVRSITPNRHSTLALEGRSIAESACPRLAPVMRATAHRRSYSARSVAGRGGSPLAIPAHLSWPRPPARSRRRPERAIVVFLACRAVQRSEKTIPAGQRGRCSVPRLQARRGACAGRPHIGQRPSPFRVRPAHAVPAARESPGSGDDLSPDGRRAWGGRTVEEDDVALKKEQINRSKNRA